MNWSLVIAAVSITCLQTICLKGFISLTWHSSTSSLVTLIIITILPYFHGLPLSLVSILLQLCVWPLSFQFFATKLFCVCTSFRNIIWSVCLLKLLEKANRNNIFYFKEITISLSSTFLSNIWGKTFGTSSVNCMCLLYHSFNFSSSTFKFHLCPFSDATLSDNNNPQNNCIPSQFFIIIISVFVATVIILIMGQCIDFVVNNFERLYDLNKKYPQPDPSNSNQT